MGDSWPQIISFEAPKVKPFPVQSLPQALREYVEQVAESYQVPADLPGCLGLAVIAASIAKAYGIELGNDWREPSNLYVAVVLPSGQRKSAVFNEMTRPLEQAERNARSRTQSLGIAPDASMCSRYIVDDVSPEELAQLLAVHGRIALMSSEGGLFGMMAGRYSKGVPNLDVYLKGHSGDPLRVDRKNSPPSHVQNPALTVALTIQPDVLDELASQPCFRGRGILARFLYAVPLSVLGNRKVATRPVTPETREGFNYRIDELLKQQHSYARDSSATRFSLDLEAAEAFLEYRESVERRLAPNGSLASIADWGGKLPGAIARIAAGLHAFQHWDNPAETKISRHTLASAIALGEYFQTHAIAAFDTMGADPLVESARALSEWISRYPMRMFSERDAFQSNKHRFKRMSHLRPALMTLEERGYIRAESGALVNAFRSSGRPAGRRYEVNPILRRNESYPQNPQKSVN